MPEYVTIIQTTDGPKAIDYNALANKPIPDTTLAVDGGFADAKSTGDAIARVASNLAGLTPEQIGALPNTYVPPAPTPGAGIEIQDSSIVNAGVRSVVTGETNDTLNLKDYAFLRGQQYTLAGWNTKADGSGKAYSVNDVYTLSDSITLYAQWKARSFTYDGAGCAAGDQVSFDITPADGTVQATLSVVSVKNNSPFDRMALAILAVYDGEGKMLAAEASELYITSEGVSGKLSVEYNADLVLNACQLFLLDGQSLEAMSDVIYTTFQ